MLGIDAKSMRKQLKEVQAKNIKMNRELKRVERKSWKKTKYKV